MFVLEQSGGWPGHWAREPSQLKDKALKVVGDGLFILYKKNQVLKLQIKWIL